MFGMLSLYFVLLTDHFPFSGPPLRAAVDMEVVRPQAPITGVMSLPPSSVLAPGPLVANLQPACQHRRLPCAAPSEASMGESTHLTAGAIWYVFLNFIKRCQTQVHRF